MRKIIFIIASLLFFFPFNFVVACDQNGYTIVYVNGILTTQDEARADLAFLKEKITSANLNNTFVINGYNSTHLAGAGDWIKSVQQAYVGKEDIPIDDYDLRNILLQIHNEVKTKKILLVGHSQGTFYTNALYDYLTKNGVPKESIKVYNLATPASFVAGDVENKRYLTSSNDRLIAEVRKLSILGGANSPLGANDTLQSLDDNGHGFSSTYLAGAPVKIVSTIENALNSLVVSPVASSECFSAPPENLAYKAQKLAFAVADPVSEKTWQGVTAGYSGVQYAINGVSNTLASVAQSVAGILAGSEPTAAVIAASESISDVEKTLLVQPQPIIPVIEVPTTEVTEPVAMPLPESEITPPPASSSVEEPVIAAEFAPSTEFLEPKFVGGFQPGFGGGGAPPAPVPESEPEIVIPPPPPDTTPPAATTLSITECALSLTAGGCTIAAGAASLSWIATDADYYGVFDNGALLSTTTSLAASLTATVGAHSFEITSYDLAGNSATSSPATTTAVVLPSISYYCDPHTSTYIDGGVYLSDGNGCHANASAVTGTFWMLDTYKGTVGNSSIIAGNSFSFNPSINTLDYVYPIASSSDRFFVVIYETRSGPAFNGEYLIFRDYFKTNAAPPPHLNFGIINWVYGP